MPLKLPLFVQSINNLSDARFFSVYEADWLCYTCNSVSPNYLAPASIKEIHGWVSGPKLCLNCIGLPQTKIYELIDELQPGAILIDQFQQIDSQKEIQQIHSILIDKTTTYSQLQELNFTGVFLLDFTINSISFSSVLKDGIALSVDDLKLFSSTNDVFIHIQLNSDEVDEFVNLNAGLVVEGGHEEQVGIRSFEDVQELMEALEVWE